MTRPASFSTQKTKFATPVPGAIVLSYSTLTWIGLLFPWPFGGLTTTDWPEPLGHAPAKSISEIVSVPGLPPAGAKTSAFVGVCGFVSLPVDPTQGSFG